MHSQFIRQHQAICEIGYFDEDWKVWAGIVIHRWSIVRTEGFGSVVFERHKPSDETDIQSNLIEIRRYLETHVRSAGQDNGGSPDEPDLSEIYRHAEYSDGRRPRFAPTDLVLIGMVLTIVGLVAVFLIY